MYGQVGGNKKGWLLLKNQEVVVPVICTPSSGLLLGGLDNCEATLTWHMERIQNYALRVILRKPPLTSSELLWQTLGWTTLKARGHNAMPCQVHRCCTNQAPPYLCLKFAPNSDLNYIRTRGSNYTCQDHRSIFITQVLSSKEPCVLITYLSISESLRAVNNLRLPYFSIVIIIIHSCFLCFCFFYLLVCCCFFLFVNFAIL